MISDLILSLVVVTGFPLFTAYFIRRFVLTEFEKSLSSERLSIAIQPLFLFFSWASGLGLRGAIGTWLFFQGVPLSQGIYFLAAIGAIGWFLTIRHYWKNKRFNQPRQKLTLDKISKRHWLIAFLLCFQGLFYLFTAIAPWSHMDSMVGYGYLSKLIANDWWSPQVYLYISHMSGDKIGQVLTAQSYFVLDDTQLPRLLRLVNLAFILIGTYGMLRLLGVRLFWSLVGLSSLLVVPEIVVHGTNLKVDIICMTMELSALYLIFILLSTKFNKAVFGKSGLVYFMPNTIFMAMIFGILAFSTRMSGIYLAVPLSIYATVVYWNNSPNSSLFLRRFALVILAWIILAGGYIYFLTETGNPIYPFKAPWPFDNGLTGSGVSHSLEKHREVANLQGIPPVIEQLYLIIHMALGLETISQLKGFSFLPHALGAEGSLFMLHPALLVIFTVPFFFRKDRSIVILSIMFMIMLTIWSNGLHYSRVFLASATLPLLIAMIIADQQDKTWSQSKRALKKLIQIGLIFTLFAHLGHVGYRFFGSNRYPYSLSVLYDKTARHDHKINFVRRILKISGIVSIEKDSFPSLHEAQKISAILGEYGQPLVHIDFWRGQQVLFEHGVFVGYYGSQPLETRFREKAQCILKFRPEAVEKLEMDEIRKLFPFERYRMEGGEWVLMCRTNAGKNLL
jgi:hypothetical protein